MQTATNPETGEKVFWNGSSWEPVKTATNPQTGDKLGLINNKWVPLTPKEPAQEKPYSLDQRTQQYAQGAYQSLSGFGSRVEERTQRLQQAYPEDRPVGAVERAEIVASEAARTAATGVGLLYSSFAPDFVKEGFENAWASIKTKPMIQQGLEYLDAGLDKYFEWAQKNPGEAEALETVVDVIGLAAPQLKTGIDLEKPIIRATREITKINIDEFRGKVKNMFKPERFSRWDKTEVMPGLLERRVWVPDDNTETTMLRMETIDGFDPDRSFHYNMSVLDKDIVESSNKIDKIIKQNKNPKIDKQEVFDDLDDLLSELDEDPKFIAMDGNVQQTTLRYIDYAKSLIDKYGSTTAGLMQARREFDGWLKKATTGTYNPSASDAKGIASRVVRNLLNEKVKNAIPNDDIHDLLDRQHHAYLALDNFAPKRAKEANNKLADIWKSFSGQTNLPKNPLSLWLTVSGAAAGASYVAGGPIQAATTLAAAGGVYGLVKAGSRKNRINFYRSVLKGIDEAARSVDNADMVKKLKADRIYIIGLLDEARQENTESQ